MKVNIKTAHGYLSFQPDGRLEYRPAPGPWEEIDIEGLELTMVIDELTKVIERGREKEQENVPPIVGPAPSQSAAYVAAVKAQLEAQGVDLRGPCGAFAITKRVAWGLRHLGCGLLSKPSGNNCEGFATDIVMFKDQGGNIIDVLGDGGGNNTPLWTMTDTVDPARWRPPVSPE